MKIRAYIYQCRDLPAADADGSSDPYITAWDTSGKMKKTSVIDDNNNPLFYESIELDYEVNDSTKLETFPPFILDVYDYDSGIFDSKDDFLGRAIVEPKNARILTQE